MSNVTALLFCLCFSSGSMEKMVELGVLVLVALGFIGWLGGGRRWAFRTMLGVMLVSALAVCFVFLYGYSTAKIAEHRERKIHDCAVAKVADIKCDKVSEPPDAKSGYQVTYVCPAYLLDDNATAREEEYSLRLAEQECRGEMNPGEKSLHEQIVQYRRDHGIKEAPRNRTSKQSKEDIFDRVACAAKIRKEHPGAYKDLDDETLVKKMEAKDPYYCLAEP